MLPLVDGAPLHTQPLSDFDDTDRCHDEAPGHRCPGQSTCSWSAMAEAKRPATRVRTIGITAPHLHLSRDSRDRYHVKARLSRQCRTHSGLPRSDTIQFCNMRPSVSSSASGSHDMIATRGPWQMAR